MDSVDLKLLKMLNANARIPISKMGKEVGLSTSGVRRRIKLLERSGLIKGYTTIIDPKKLDRGLLAFVSVDIDFQGMQKLISRLSKSHEVCELHRTTGGHNLMIKIRVKDLESLNKFIKENIYSFDPVKNVRTVVVMETIKETLVNL
ncbi:MAG: Lrp/AsnC family transcriptional regulator [Candidatus Hadarchaeales archaeon]